MLPTPLACTHPPTVVNHANPSHFRTPRTFNLLAYTAAAVYDAPRSTTSGSGSGDYCRPPTPVCDKRAVPNGFKQMPGLRPLLCSSSLCRATIADNN
ncbi:hypothetical protein COCMIDRAFT_38795 [Bipolaris oryzae ATCC 44560]|uniref:Uncharacterized protein n=1 Tax=Bipolaris oryzae ATCC 44560 TaxID=930090 RepID=W6Z063_COCMI|nr:uncharacterized protein COCMIDRAFT_38795 [Bipolaris oryzae ATCC 44560]EUC43260.1 hypothetical protein COCMIDRAFT_38795 [Bipolaris oryzae ATCC 44560]